VLNDRNPPTALIYKTSSGTRRWRADLEFPDGKRWPSWMSGHRTKSDLMRAISAIAIPVTTERRKDMDQ
jgi:hypothetical protein